MSRSETEFGSLVAWGSQTVGPGLTADVPTASGTFYAELVLPTGRFEGSARVISNSTKKVMCSAQAMATRSRISSSGASAP